MRNHLYAATLIAAALQCQGAFGATEICTVTTQPGNRTVTVTALTPDIIKVTNTAPGEITEPSRTLLDPSCEGETASVNVLPDGTQVLATSTGITAILSAGSGAVTICGSRGSRHAIHDTGLRGTDSLGRRTMELTAAGSGDAVFYGAGERGHSLNLAGDTLVMYNRQNYGYTGDDPRISQMNITMPLLVSPQGYAIVVDDYAAAELVAGTPLKYASESPAPLTYYYIDSPEGFGALPPRLSQLIGRQELPPFWSLGYITSKYGYKTQQETLAVVDELKKAGYPLDGIVLDLYWYGQEEDMGRLAWEPSQWPQPEKMLRMLRKKGVNLVAISQPYVLRNGRGIDNYNDLSARGLFGKDSVGGTKEVEIWVGEGGMLDVSNPETCLWLRERYRTLTDGGITGWWGDLGEPEKHPEGMHHANGLTTRQYHNLYGNDWSRIIHTLFKEEYPDRRLMTLMRGGTTGLQRYSVFPWSTDVSRSWGGLQPQVKIMLNSGLSGLGYMSHDVGGFAIDKENPVDPELYVRWLQLGLFSPILRTHSQEYAEPHLYKEHQHIILPLVKARYEWLPYNYTLAYENASQGLPLVRPIDMYAPASQGCDTVADQYLWGRDVMVAPVMRQGATERRVRIPQGAWVNINNPSQVITGDTTLTVDAPLEVLPLFARAGALLPKAGYPMENTLGYNPADYTVDYYPVDPESIPSTAECASDIRHSSFDIYEDDRTSPASLERGEYAMVRLTADNTPQTITLTAAVEGSYPGIPTRRTLTFVVHNTTRPASVTATTSSPEASAPSSATAGSSTLKVKTTYDAATRTLRVTVPRWLPATPLTVAIAR